MKDAFKTFMEECEWRKKSSTDGSEVVVINPTEKAAPACFTAGRERERERRGTVRWNK